MDTSEQYIKMCEEATEVQGEWIPDDWDYCHCKTEEWVVVLSGYETDGGYYGHQTPSESKISYYTGSCDDISAGDFKARHVQLPRQDQLQEMMSGEWYGILNKFFSFAFEPEMDESDEPTVYWVAHSFTKQFTSMEQLWLAFVMKEKYGKVWNNEEWTLS